MATFGQRVGLAAKAVTGIFSDTMSENVARMMGGVLPGGYGLPPVRGTREFLRAYSQLPWLRAVGERIATAVAQTEWQLFVLKRGMAPARKSVRLVIDGLPVDVTVNSIHRADPKSRRKMLKAAVDSGDLTQITDHPMLTAIAGGNSFQTGLGMRKVTQLHLDIVGDAFWLKERDGRLADAKNPGGTVVGLWPVPPDWIIATPTPATRYFRVSFRGWQGNIPDTEFVWFSMDDPSNPYGRGSGTAIALADELETDEYTSKHVKAFFYNRARPDLIIWPKEGNANEANVKRIEQQWLQASQGFFRAFKPFFMTRAVEVKELEMNFRALELNKLRQFERDCVMQVFGIPPEILGVIEHSNKSTIDAADYIMARYVVSPRLEFMRSVLQERLAPEYDDKLIVEFPNPVVEDETMQQTAATAAPWSLTVDEWRERSGHKPLEDEKIGSMHFIPALGKLTSEDEILNPPEPPPQLAPGQPANPAKPLKPKPGGESPGLAPGAPGSESPVEPKQIGKYSETQPRDDHGQWTDGGGSGASGEGNGPSAHDMATLDTEYLSTPSEALQLIRDGMEATVAPEDLRGVLKKAAKGDDHPDLSNLTIEGTRVFHGGLNLPRNEMPQIPDTMQATLFAELKDKGISVTKTSIDPLKLGPTQNQIDAKKVGEMVAKYESGEKKDLMRPILVSKDSWVLDGHHRWATMTAMDVDTPSNIKLKIPVFKIGLDHRKALSTLLDFTRKHNIPTLEHGKVYRLATIQSLGGYKVGDRFTDPSRVVGVTSLDALARAKTAAGLNGSVRRVTIQARAWDFERGGAVLLAGLTYQIVRISEESVDVEVVA